MPTVFIPPLLRKLTRDQESVAVKGGTLREVIDALDAEFPGIKDRLLDGDAMRAGLAVVIDTQVMRGGLDETIREESEVHFIPAVAGGTGEGDL